MTAKFDLSLLAKPLQMTAPGLGELSIDLFGVFQDWLAKGLDKGLWKDGEALIRAVLAEQATTADDAPFDPAAVAALDASQLETAAGAFLAMTGLALRPAWIRREGGGRRVRARKRRDDEIYDMAPREGETERDRLLRVARDWREDRRLRDAELVAMALGPNHDVLMDTMRRAEELDRLARAAALPDTYRTTATEAFKRVSGIDASTVSATQAALKDFDFASVAAGQKALRGVDVSGLFDAQRTFADHLPRAISVGAEIERLTQANRPAYDALSQVLTDQTRSIKAALALTRGPEFGAAVDRLMAFTRPRSYFEEVERRLHVATPAAGLAAALAAAQATAWPSAEMLDVMAQVPALRPGYHMTAALGLTENALRGVAADVLRFYEAEPDPAAPVFAAVMRTARSADIVDIEDGEIEQLRATIRELQAQVRREKDPVQRHGLFEIIHLIGMIVNLLIAGTALGVASAAFIADQADREQQAAFQVEMRRDQAEARAEAAERYRTTRYIATDGPLRLEPHAGGPVLQYVYAGQLAVAKDQRDGWVMVEVFSYAHEQSMIGWIPARRLKVGP